MVTAAFVLTQPVLPFHRLNSSRSAPSNPQVDPGRLQMHVERLAGTFAPRDLEHSENLEQAAAYVEARFRESGGRFAEERFLADGKPVRNLIVSFGPEEGERLIVGAHYDACCGMPGADDNASGVAALLELAPLLRESAPAIRVDLVAFTLEEPPYFGSPQMGSAVHARLLKKKRVAVRAMIGLEMIGDFSDRPGSQSFPFPALKLLYPSRGDFIAVGGRFGDIALVRRVKKAMMAATDLPVRSINAPARFAGLDLSDHASFWREGYPAVLITDTAFYRNSRYHTAQDTPGLLDYQRMAKVVVGVRGVISELSVD